HRVLTHLSDEELRAELSIPRQVIRERVGVEAQDIAYPNGWYNRSVISEIVAAGYRSAVTTEARYNGLGADPFRIGRFTLWEGSSLGPLGYSDAIAACQLDGTFSALGIPKVVSGLSSGWPEEPSANVPSNRAMNTLARPEAVDARRNGSVSAGARPTPARGSPRAAAAAPTDPLSP
ncbi:MAG: polysaccharide deacetylase family protein, partial [Deltaproteobacteria bacterium]